MNNSVGRATSRRRTTRKSGLQSFVLSLQLILLGFMGIGIGAAGAIFYSVSGINVELTVRTTKEDTKIISSDGVVLATLFQEEHRERVPIEQIPQNLRNATVAIEDSRFYKHAGVDIRGISRALYENTRYHKLMQGGSTITQQLARNVYLTKRKTLTRKLQEAALAIRIESQYPKDHILEVYLNQVYYGSGAYGVQTASHIYFGKDVNKLDLAECAMLAGMPKRPSYYSPFVDKQAARSRRNTVLQRMADLGYITQTTADEAKNGPIRLTSKKPIRRLYRAGYFIDYVVKQLVDNYGEDLIMGGGLRVYTTLNWEMQQAAQEDVANGVKEAQKSGKNVGQAALIAIEPGTGHIKAMVGGTSYATSQFNRVTQGYGRQPGSSFKAFVYTAAIDRGVVEPDSQILDSPVSYPNGTGGYWSPSNYDNKWHGWVTVRQAISRSINIPAIKVAHKVGVPEIIKYAHMMGIKSELEPYLPLAIGGIKGVHPIEMAAAYAVFASGGIYAEPMAITKVTDTEGGVIEENEPVAHRVLSESTAEIMDQMLRGVVTDSYGTGKRVRDVPEARGKTGTTNRDIDAWFLGYVPNKICTAVWAGNDDHTPMRNAFGSTVCIPIWKPFTLTALKIYSKEEPEPRKRSMAVVHDDQKDKPQEATNTDTSAAPASTDQVVTVTVCTESQFLSTRWCPETYRETFTAGAAPDRVCSIHGPPNRTSPSPAPAKPEEDHTQTTTPTVEPIRLAVCADTGKIATRYCPRRVVKTFTMANTPSEVCDVHQRM